MMIAIWVITAIALFFVAGGIIIYASIGNSHEDGDIGAGMVFLLCVALALFFGLLDVVLILVKLGQHQ